MTIPIVNDRRWSAVVIHQGECALGGPTAARTYSYIPAGLLEDTTYMLDQAAATMQLSPEADGVLIVPHLAGISHWTATATKGLDGWTAASGDAIDADSGWRTIVRDRDKAALHVGIMGAIDPGRTPLFTADQDADAIASALGRYRALTGASWRATAGVAGCAAIRTIHARNARSRTLPHSRPVAQPYWRWDGHPGFLRGVGDLVWHRDATLPDGAGWSYVQFDMRSMYLAAAAAAELAFSPLEHTGATLFDPHWAGYWQIDVAGVPADGLWMPPLIDHKRVDHHGRVWVTTPIMAYLLDHGINPEVVDAWVCARSGRYLRTWAERIRDGLYMGGAPELVRAALKRTYTEAVGMMGRKGGSIYRPDWRDTIIDLARVNMLRKLDNADRSGYYPHRVYVDSVWYALNEHSNNDSLHALGVHLGVGPGMGKFRYERGLTPAEYTDRYHRPRKATR